MSNIQFGQGGRLDQVQDDNATLFGENDFALVGEEAPRVAFIAPETKTQAELDGELGQSRLALD